MKNYKLIELLKTFDKKEFKRFKQFVSSPFYNKNKYVNYLLLALEQYHPDFNSPALNLENLSKQLYDISNYDYHKVSNVISDLYNLAEKFIIVINLEKDKHYQNMLLLRGLRSRLAGKLYEQNFKKIGKEIESKQVKDENYFYEMYELYDDYLWYATHKNPNKEINIVQKEFDNFFYFSLIRLVRFYSLMLHERKQNNVEYDMKMIDEVISYIHSKSSIDNASYLVFTNILQLLKTNEVEYYNKLKELKSKYFAELKFDDQYMLYVHMYDFCAYMVNFKNDDSYNHDMFEIYKEMIEHKLMTKESFLYPNFMNVVKIACRVQKYDYAESFINEFECSIPEEEKDNVLAFCRGVMAFSKGELNSSLEAFSRSAFQNFIFKVQVKIYLLKIYYMLGMYEQALSFIDTFKHYINREENLLPEHSQSYSIFLKLVGELIKVKEQSSKLEKEFKMKKINEEIKVMPANPFRIKAWLLQEAAGKI